MSQHTRRNVLRGTAALAAAGGFVAAGPGTRREAVAAEAEEAAGTRHFPFLEGAFEPVTEELTAPVSRPTAAIRPTGRWATRSTSTTCCAAPRRSTGCPGTRRRARRCSCRPTRVAGRRRRTTGTPSRTCTIRIAGRPTCWSSPPRTSRASRSPGSSCPDGCRSAFTGAGFRTPDTAGRTCRGRGGGRYETGPGLSTGPHSFSPSSGLPNPPGSLPGSVRRQI